MLALAAVSLALVTRYLGPAQYGEFALAIAYLSLFGVIADVGLFTILVREISRREEDTSRLVGNVMVLRAALALGVVVVAALLSLAFPYTQQTRVAILIYAVPFVLGLLNGALVAIFQSRLRMDRAVLGDVAGRAASLAALAVVIAADLGFYAVVVTAAVGAAAQLAVSLALSRRHARVRPRAEPTVWKRLLKASIPLGLSLAVTELYFRVDTLIISFLRPVSDVGLYALSYRIFELLAMFSAIVLASVFPLLSREEGDPRRVLQAASDLFVIVGLPLAVGGGIVAEGLVELAGGEAFSGADDVMRLLLVAGALAYVNGLLGYALIARDRQRDLLWLNLGTLAVNVVLNVILVDAYGIVAAAAVMIGCELVIFAGCIVFMRRTYRFIPSFAVALRALPAALVMGAVVWLLRDAPVLAAIAVGAVVYGTLLWLFGGVDRELLRRVREG